MNAVVTGGAGFIGSHLVEELVSRGYRVTVIDDLTTGHEQNFARVRDSIEFVRGDITDAAALSRALDGAEYVFHVAAIPGVPVSIKDPEGTRRVNVEGTRAVADAARKVGVKRIVFSSSAAVYGDTSVIPTPESAPARPISPYGEQKLEGERLMSAANAQGLETVCLRYFNVFGERQNPHGAYAAVIPLFIARMQAGEAPRINGDGMTTRDFTYVRNVVEANILAATTPGLGGEIFNIASGEKISLNDLVSAINAGLHTAINPSYGAFREGDIKESCADISKARAVLGYTPSVSFEEGIRKTLAAL